jgi:hypothetical protein
LSAVFDLYGVDANTLEDARRSVEHALSIAFSRHESAYRGGEYFRASDTSAEHLILQRNHDAAEDGWMEPQHRDAPFLLYVERPSDAEALRAQLERVPSIRRLRRTP